MEGKAPSVVVAPSWGCQASVMGRSVFPEGTSGHCLSGFPCSGRALSFVVWPRGLVYGSPFNKGTLIWGSPAPYRILPGSQGPGGASQGLLHPAPGRPLEIACHDLYFLPTPGAASLPPTCCLGISVLGQARPTECGHHHQAKL